jgi:hypothetical protein
MNFIRRWRHSAERDQEQLLVRLWTMNSMNADADGQLTRPASRLACDAQSELISSLKYLSSSEATLAAPSEWAERDAHLPGRHGGL